MLAVTAVSKRYGGVQALDGVSLSTRRGEVLGLLGANGAGKTTLIDILGGEQHADAGEVVLDGRPLRGAPHLRARLGLARTFQHPKVAPGLTVLENVAVGLAVEHLSGRGRTLRTLLRAVLTGQSRSVGAAREACEAVGLVDLDRQASLLSFGEIRLVEVARALVQNPRVLLLDEPFPGLEDDGVAALAAAIRGAVDSGRSIVLVDHNLSIVSDLVDRVVLLVRGTVAFSGSVDACFASSIFQEEYVGGRA